MRLRCLVVVGVRGAEGVKVDVQTKTFSLGQQLWRDLNMRTACVRCSKGCVCVCVYYGGRSTVCAVITSVATLCIILGSTEDG